MHSNSSEWNMKTTIHTNGNEVIIRLEGRLDTSTSPAVSAEIDSQLSAFNFSESEGALLSVDASQLEFISSSGLRVLLSLAKRYKEFSVKGVQPQVYDVLDTTGFTQIMTVERAMRKLSINGCPLIGAGGVGKVYRLDGDTIIKVFRKGTTMDEVRREITLSKEAFVLGMPTAISFDVVTVTSSVEDEAECLGLVYELLKAETLSTMLRQHPEQIDTFARKYAELFRQLHAIEVPKSGNIPSAVETARKQVEHISRYFPRENIDMLLSIIDSIPAGNRLLHMDLQTKNAMMQDNELMLIDMGELGYGHPMLDFGNAYSAMVSFVGDYEKVIGLPRELGKRLWDLTIDYYMEGLPADVVAERKAQTEVVSCVRNFSWLSLSDSFPEEVIMECKELFDERITKRYDYIKNVCKTFEHWTL